MKKLFANLQECPVIAAVKEEKFLQPALASPCRVIFLLTGNICSVENIVKQIQNAGKNVYIHIDLLEGFGKYKYALAWIKERVAPDGIITTKTALVKIARDIEMAAIQRVFLIDNLSFTTGVQSIRQFKPSAVEIMPGIMPAITGKMCQAISIPVIAGGLVNDMEDIRTALKAGAVGVSTSSSLMWEFKR
jgi:glycerol uptake operon antiterminator